MTTLPFSRTSMPAGAYQLITEEIQKVSSWTVKVEARILIISAASMEAGMQAVILAAPHDEQTARQREDAFRRLNACTAKLALLQRELTDESRELDYAMEALGNELCAAIEAGVDEAESMDAASPQDGDQDELDK